MLNHWFGARWFGYLGCSYERACYLRAPLESQTTSNPNQQLTISWLERRTSPSNWRVSYPSISRGVCGSFATRLHATASLAGGRLRELRERTCFFVEGDGVSWIYFWPLPPLEKKRWHGVIQTSLNVSFNWCDFLLFYSCFSTSFHLRSTGRYSNLWLLFFDIHSLVTKCIMNCPHPFLAAPTVRTKKTSSRSWLLKFSRVHLKINPLDKEIPVYRKAIIFRASAMFNFEGPVLRIPKTDPVFFCFFLNTLEI